VRVNPILPAPFLVVLAAGQGADWLGAAWLYLRLLVELLLGDLLASSQSLAPPYLPLCGMFHHAIK
jgi:hypothetical protein